MRFLYVDESGTAAQIGESKYFVFGGVVLGENTWHEFEGDLDGIITANLGKNIELHAGNLRSGRGKYRKISEQRRWKCIDDVFDLLVTNVARIPVFLVAVAMEDIRPNQPIRGFAAVCLREAFKQYMRSQEIAWSNRRAYNARKARFERGLIICDQQGRAEAFQKLFASLHDNVKPDRHMLVENLIFKDSQASRLIQAADLVCHFLYRLLYGKNLNFAERLGKCFVALENSRGPQTPISFRYISDRPPIERPPLFPDLPVDSQTNLPYGSYMRPPYANAPDPRWTMWPSK